MLRWVALSLPLCSAIALSSLMTAPAAAAPVPSGSYLDSCKGVSFDPATNLLRANCISANEGGQFEIATSPLDTSNCAEGSIWNDDGQLYCLAKAAWGKGATVPPGSYIATCTQRSVVNDVLMAQCGRPGGESSHSALNLKECRWGGDISNQNGVLTCEPAMVQLAPVEAAPGGVKLAPVEPGIVKPVGIAPVPPADASAAPDDGDSKKKKRRNRGERG